jgi:transcriptional regulator with XRE-family HTH domain
MKRRSLESLGRLVREKRADKKLRETATEIRISAPTLLRIEAGRTPDIETFGKVCEWLGISPAEFLGSPAATSSTGADATLVVSAHLKAEGQPKPETINALAQMILLASKMQPRKTE